MSSIIARRRLMGLMAAFLLSLSCMGCSDTGPSTAEPPSTPSSETTKGEDDADGGDSETSRPPEAEHILDSNQVATLQAAVSFNDDTIIAAGPQPSYTTGDDGSRNMSTMLNQDQWPWPEGKYGLHAFCTGEGSIAIDFTIGENQNHAVLDCSVPMAQTVVNASGDGAGSSEVRITPDDGTEAEFAYRIDRIE